MRRLLKRTDTGIIIGCIFVFVLFSLWNPQQWFDWGNLSNIGQYTAILGLLAIGQTFVILIREIDLSVGSVYGIVGITFVSLENNNVSVPVSFILAMLLALLIGLVNAVLVVRAKLSSMIVTLGGLFFYRGLVYVTTHGAVTGVPQAARENWLAQLLGGHWLRIENELLLLLLLAFGCAVILDQTRFGSHLLAVGGDPASAESQGVPVSRVKTFAFCLCSFFAGLSAIVTLANQPQTNVSLGTGMELESIAAVVVGGTLLTGGRGTMLGTVLGAFFFTAVRSQMIALGAPPSWYVAFVGIALLVVVTINTLLARRLKSA
ncbi:MAG TPA: ABC transporter permease [Terrimicrobiaceae bacterium]|jgi:ribose/xylose/arabinose/galactoside ABC-type transport system permease subunit|nr:ABC transporter permease [Terrimicrobiaceae bacterium]